ncbi:MAG TPA: hypothetical protein VEZ44_04960 [bacterium]|nr:hypothetical protein [bacterium]
MHSADAVALEYSTRATIWLSVSIQNRMLAYSILRVPFCPAVSVPGGPTGGVTFNRVEPRAPRGPEVWRFIDAA